MSDAPCVMTHGQYGIYPVCPVKSDDGTSASGGAPAATAADKAAASEISLWMKTRDAGAYLLANFHYPAVYVLTHLPDILRSHNPSPYAPPGVAEAYNPPPADSE